MIFRASADCATRWQERRHPL